jgi:iron(III) transport system ATP-binding protein
VGITSVYVTHDQAEALVMSDEIIVMSKGHIEQKGGPREIYTRPVNGYVSNFIGVVNLLKGRVIRAGDGGGQIEINQGGHCVQLPCRLGEGVSVGADAILSVRPENVQATRENGGGPCLEGEVLQAIFLGNCIDCRVRWGEFEWKVLAHPRTRLRQGEKVFLRLDPAHSLAVLP